MTTVKKVFHDCETEILSGASYCFRSQDAAAREQRRQTGNTRTMQIGEHYVGAGQRWLVKGKQVHYAIGRGGALIELVDVSGTYESAVAS